MRNSVRGMLRYARQEKECERTGGHNLKFTDWHSKKYKNGQRLYVRNQICVKCKHRKIEYSSNKPEVKI